MQNKELAFVLKRFLPQKQKVVLLSAQNGKIEIITNPVAKCIQLWPGMLISYELNFLLSRVYVAQNIDILLTPQELTFFDINWIHHFLELCYYFIPAQSPCNEIFSYLYSSFFMTRLQNNFINQEMFIIKKICILKLLCLLGFYPSDEFKKYLNFYDQLTSLSIDFEYGQKVDSLKRNMQMISNQQIKLLDEWLLECFKSHPSFNLFKTICSKNQILIK